jgi:dihydroorotate dehydrogenase electron transfer subunit
MKISSKPFVERVQVVSNIEIARGVGLLTLQAPHCADRIRPGQFVHMRIESRGSEILRRPFSVYRVVRDTLQIIFQVVGKGTRTLAEVVPGHQGMDVIGPLGTGWTIPDDVSHALVATGGLGAAPMGMLVEELSQRGVATVVAMGAPCAHRLVAHDHFLEFARRVVVATDDGTSGSCGLVTDVTGPLFAQHEFDVVFACGPEAMQRAVARQALDANVACQVSLERLMACGIGACLSCVVDTAHGQRRACVDGPVFDAREVIWPDAE